jgi:hypothetical protein
MEMDHSIIDIDVRIEAAVVIREAIVVRVVVI